MPITWRRPPRAPGACSPGSSGGTPSGAWTSRSSTSAARAPRATPPDPRPARGPGPRRFGLEPQRILRLEKQHILVGQDTDSESNLLSAGLDWLPKLDKDDFVGKWATELVAERGVRERLPRLAPGNPAAPPRGGGGGGG